MNNTSKSVLLWILAFILMAAFAIYQRMTGPTYPVHGKVSVNKEEIEYTLPRTHEGDGNEIIKIIAKDKSVFGYMFSKRYKSFDENQRIILQRNGDTLLAELPHQPLAGKIMYDIYLSSSTGNPVRLAKEPVVIRFKGFTPRLFLWPHILLIFLAMCFSTRTGLEALFNGSNVLKLTIWTSVLIFFGGMVMGAIIQKFSFDAYWTGFPFGFDLTDNKTLIAFIMWIVALWRISKRPDQLWWAIIAAIVTIGVFSVPHSVLGSEIDYTKVPVH